MSAAYRRPKQDRTRPHRCRTCGSTLQLVVWKTPNRSTDGVAWCRKCRPVSREQLLEAVRRPDD
eukprot:3404500-Lingulodinium_polyedra.AAC.1